MWKLLPLTVAIWALLLAAVVGGMFGLSGILPRGAPQLRKYVWFVALPCLILDVTMSLDLTGLGKVVATFVQWRAVFFGIALMDALRLRKGVLAVVEAWLALSWVSTVLVGFPMLLAITDIGQAARMSLGAAISSFVFQLPLQIVLLEIGSATSDAELTHWTVPLKLGGIVLLRLLQNPVAWAICLGCTMSRTNIGDDAEEDAYWRCFHDTFELLGACATPLALCVTGTYFARPMEVKAQPQPEAKEMTEDPESPLEEIEETTTCSTGAWFHEMATRLGGAFQDARPTIRSLVFLWIKITGAPGLMYFLAQKNLNRRDMRAAVLLAATPASSAAVVIAQKYHLDDKFCAHQALYGLVLLLPTVLFWSEIMDDNDIP